MLLCTSKNVRTDMSSWLFTDAGDTWSVKLAVRDLGGHLDVTYRALSEVGLLGFGVVPLRFLLRLFGLSW